MRAALAGGSHADGSTCAADRSRYGGQPANGPLGAGERRHGPGRIAHRRGGPGQIASGVHAEGACPGADGRRRRWTSPVIEWRCSPHFQNTGLYPAIDFYERALDFGLAEPAEAQFDRLLSRLETYDLARPETVPLWASLLGLPTPDRFPPLSLSPTRQREETFRVMREWLHMRAARKPGPVRR